MSKQPLYLRLYFQPVLYEAARIIGYDGCAPFDFWDAAKKLGIPQQKLFDAVYELTRTDRREASPPRYELREDVKQLCWQLLGPPPGHPEYVEKAKTPEPAAEADQAEPVKKPRKRQGRGR
jgi:hypothetical protein